MNDERLKPTKRDFEDATKYASTVDFDSIKEEQQWIEATAYELSTIEPPQKEKRGSFTDQFDYWQDKLLWRCAGTEITTFMIIATKSHRPRSDSVFVYMGEAELARRLKLGSLNPGRLALRHFVEEGVFKKIPHSPGKTAQYRLVTDSDKWNWDVIKKHENEYILKRMGDDSKLGGARDKISTPEETELEIQEMSREIAEDREGQTV